MLIKSNKILVTIGLLLAIFTVRIEGGKRAHKSKNLPKNEANVNNLTNEIENIKNEEKLAEFWKETTPEIISYFDIKFPHHLKYVDFLKNLLKVFNEASKSHEEPQSHVKKIVKELEIEAKKLHETLIKHSDEVKKIIPKIKQEIGLEKNSRKASVKREFIEIYAKVELSKTIHEALSKAEHLTTEVAKKASQMKNKKKGKKAAVDTTIQGIIKELTFEHVSKGVFHLILGAKKSKPIKEEISKAFDEMVNDHELKKILKELENALEQKKKQLNHGAHGKHETATNKDHKNKTNHNDGTKPAGVQIDGKESKGKKKLTHLQVEIPPNDFVSTLKEQESSGKNKTKTPSTAGSPSKSESHKQPGSPGEKSGNDGSEDSDHQSKMDDYGSKLGESDNDDFENGIMDGIESPVEQGSPNWRMHEFHAKSDQPANSDQNLSPNFLDDYNPMQTPDSDSPPQINNINDNNDNGSNDDNESEGNENDDKHSGDRELARSRLNNSGEIPIHPRNLNTHFEAVANETPKAEIEEENMHSLNSGNDQQTNDEEELPKEGSTGLNDANEMNQHAEDNMSEQHGKENMEFNDGMNSVKQRLDGAEDAFDRVEEATDIGEHSNSPAAAAEVMDSAKNDGLEPSSRNSKSSLGSPHKIGEVNVTNEVSEHPIM